ncbi:PREDICTED: telomere length regulation protein TEL2 homolog isoform X2 [Poecilia mexicana]|uniref:telomere length regulation protein TEL2 homolog isoform X2 n=1 Tax=Poecilia mexicana TaxID=48701 RepID=UPI00072DAD58|nr:PREDICTED: telomere length regulation protein TEL2 homolog isoform X2 [Poecilia mexicana]
MESGSISSEVRLKVAQCFRTLSSSADHTDVFDALETLNSYLDDGAESSRCTAAEREEFRRTHYSRTLRVLVGQLQADWTHSLSAAQRSQLWDPLFLKGPPDQALLVLMEAVTQLRPSAGLDRLVSVTERFLQSGRLADLLWSFCLGSVPSDSAQLRETLLARLAALPDLTANRLHPNNRPLFTPQRFYPLLASEMLAVLERTCRALRDGVDCSLTFVAQTLGKVCLQGHSGPVLAVMAPRLAVCTRSDMVWQRVSWKLLQDVPERCMESVLTGLLQAADSPDAFSRITGNLVLTNKKAQFVLTHKVLLLQYKYQTRVLRTVLGYLASDRDRRPLLIQVLRSVSQAWANPSAVKHTPQEQQLYVSKTLLLAASLLTDAELQELRSDLLQCLLGGMQSHLDSSAVGIRTLGMVVGECLSARMDLSGTKLKFEYDQNEETRELLSLMTPSVCPDPDPDRDPEVAAWSEGTRESSQVKSASQRSKSDPDSDLDSDDDLPPYDMSGDVEASRAAPPRYLRDCLEALISSDDSLRVELSLRAAESLVRRNFCAAKEISVQMTKVLLHMEDRFGISGFLVLRQAAMVALAAVDSVPVTRYLTTEFYSLNYSLRQRLDILEVLALAAQELSKPAADKVIAAASELTPYQSTSAASWRQEVEKRIQNKTKRISKGCAPPAAAAAPNRYAPVAGYFFFPLLRNYDKPEVTFDLLGSDHLVLGRLIHTLGLFMHLAVNAPIAAQMGAALLDFVWAVRYHADQTVRRGVLFAVCSVFLSMPSQALMMDLSQQLLETRTWLADVAEVDPDADCRNLAVQSLVLLDQNLKKQLQNSNGLSLES